MFEGLPLNWMHEMQLLHSDMDGRNRKLKRENECKNEGWLYIMYKGLLVKH
jgi:hypothetical protein